MKNRMKNVIQAISLVVLIMFTTSLNAWEVTTHETVTKIAVSGKNRAENLKQFINSFNLEKKKYLDKNFGSNETIYWYEGLTTASITLSGSYLNKINIIRSTHPEFIIDTAIQQGNYIGLIQAGSILEDTLISKNWHDITSARFNRHFYDPTKNGCYGLKGITTCAKEWALNSGNANDTNIHSWKSIVEENGYLLKSILGTKKEKREKAQADLFASIGFLSHMTEDMTQAAHVRNDPHGSEAVGINQFEVWANENMNNKMLYFPVCSMTAGDSLYIEKSKNAPSKNFKNYDEIFKSTATWTNKNFFSDDTYKDYDSPKNFINQIKLLDGGHFGTDYYILKSTGLDIADNTPLMFYTDTWGPIDGCGSGISCNDGKSLIQPNLPDSVKAKGITPYDVLLANANYVFPKAVSAVEGMINYLFRAKIYAYVDPSDSDKLIIKNVTNQNEVAQGLDTTFRDGTKVYIYYETKNGDRKPLPTIGEKELSDYNKNQLANDDTITISGLSSAISQVESEMNDDKTIIVALAGQMGGNGIGERAIAGAKLVFKNNASLLLSFDDSGSMGSQIEDTKQSALNLLPLFKDSNSSYIEVQAFNRSGISFTNDMNAVKNKINSLYSWGGTPLYESMISAANSAIAEKNRHPNNKVIIVLYTDGIANSDNNKQNAIDAISKVKHPEIDEVYLVFVNTGDLSGKQILEDVATRANRHFIYLQSAEQLASELQKVLQ